MVTSPISGFCAGWLYEKHEAYSTRLKKIIRAWNIPDLHSHLTLMRKSFLQWICSSREGEHTHSKQELHNQATWNKNIKKKLNSGPFTPTLKTMHLSFVTIHYTLLPLSRSKKRQLWKVQAWHSWTLVSYETASLRKVVIFKAGGKGADLCLNCAAGFATLSTWHNSLIPLTISVLANPLPTLHVWHSHTENTTGAPWPSPWKQNSVEAERVLACSG